MDNRRGFNHV